MEITRCPLELITPDIFELLEDTDLFYKGLPPVSGGTLDQAYSFIKAAQFVKATQNEILSELSEKK